MLCFRRAGRADENVMRSRLALLLVLVVGLVATGCGGAESPALKGPALRSLAQAARATEQAEATASTWRSR